MTSAGAQRRPRRRQDSDGAPPARRPRWVIPLVAGLWFGLGYAITHRLMIGGGGRGGTPMGQGFEVKPFPGTSLESLRMRYGADKSDIRGDLERLELEQAQKEDDAKRRRQEQLDRQVEADAASRSTEPELPLQPLPRAEAVPAEPSPVEPPLPPPVAPEPPAPQP